MVRLLATASVVALLAATPAFAQTTRPGDTSTAAGATTGRAPNTGAAKNEQAKSDKLSKQDKDFVRHAAIGGMAEVEMGKMAQQKAQSQEVKQFGQQMAQDHDTANSELMAVASGKGADMPKGLDKDHTKLRDKLAKLNGADFDREYMRQMVKDHQKDVKDFEKEAKSGQDSDIKDFAQSTLPKLQQHLQMAQDIDKRMRAEAPMTSQRSTAPGGTAGSSAPPATRR